jgi:hypothetical protein
MNGFDILLIMLRIEELVMTLKGDVSEIDVFNWYPSDY